MPESESDKLELKKTACNGLIPAEILDAYSLAMDQALGLQKTSLSAVAQWNMQATELAWAFAPVLCEMFGLAMRSIAGCVQCSRFLLGMPCAQAGSGQRGLPQASGGLQMAEGAAEREPEAWAAHWMDIAIGAEATADLEVEVTSVAPVLKAELEPMAVEPVHRSEAAEERALAVGNAA